MLYQRNTTFRAEHDTCTLDREVRYCKHKCRKCGFYKPESNRRKRMIDNGQLKADPETGLMRLVVVYPNES